MKKTLLIILLAIAALGMGYKGKIDSPVKIENPTGVKADSDDSFWAGFKSEGGAIGLAICLGLSLVTLPAAHVWVVALMRRKDLERIARIQKDSEG